MMRLNTIFSYVDVLFEDDEFCFHVIMQSVNRKIVIGESRLAKMTV